MQNHKPFLFFICIVIACNDSIKYPDGGYDYPKHVADEDTNFYFLPLKNRMSKKEVFDESYAYTYYRLLDEPNLSLKPLAKPVFRLTYGNYRIIIINVTENSIVVKDGNTGDAYLRDLSRLTNVENLHLNILEKWYPLDLVDKSSRHKKYLDSMIKQYPQLLDSNYYHTIYEKQFVRTNEKFNYKSWRIPISKKDYDSMSQQINSSGFWQMPYSTECKSPSFDGYSFTLEANTKHKYNAVKSGSCNDSTEVNFAKACQKIINYTHLDKEISVWHNAKNDTSHIVFQDVQLPDIKEPRWHIKQRSHQPHKEQTVQGSDTTKMP